MSAIKELMEKFGSLEEKTRKILLVAIASVMALAVALSAINSHLSTLARKKLSREQTLKEMMVLRQRHQEATADAQRLSGRISAVAPADTPATIIEQSGIAPKGSIQSKPLPRQDRGNMVEEGAEITISGLSLNEAVNLLYRLEHGTKPLSVKKGIIRSRFNDPAKLDLTIQVSLFKPSGVQEKR